MPRLSTLFRLRRPHRRARLRGAAAPRTVRACGLLLALVAIAAASARAQSFAPLQKLAGGTSGVGVGDFNGDGKQDVAAANGGNAFGGSLAIFLGNGDGTFQPKQDFPASSSAASVVVSDFNGDGKQDVALVNAVGSPAHVSILLGKGDGTFQPKADVPVLGSFLNEASAADLNRDGKPDLVVLSNDFVVVLPGNGDGTFAARRDFSAGLFPSSLTVGDFNGDGNPDVAVSGDRPGSDAPNRVSVMLGGGDGNLQAPTDYTSGLGPQNVLAHDLDGDGRLDLVTNNHRDQTVSVLLGNGDGTFRTKNDFPARVFFQAESLKIADVDGDGHSDVVTAVPEGFSVVRGRGDGTFGPPSVFGGRESGVRRIATADLSRDGKIDLLGGDFEGDAVNLLLNRTGPHAINGRVTGDAGAPIASAFVTVTGADSAAVQTLTDAAGQYARTGLSAGEDFTVSVSKVNYNFAPPSRTFDDLSSDVTADFTGTPLRYQISGVVRDNFGARLRGVTITLSGGASATATTGDDGGYAFTSLAAGLNYTVTATALPRLTFPLNTLHFNNLSSNAVGNFTAFPQTFQISGTVRDVGSNAGMFGVSVTLSGSRTATATTDFDGNYIFTSLPIGGDYTVTVSQPTSAPPFFTSRLLFAPQSVRFPDLESNATADFGGTTLNTAVAQEPRRVASAELNRDGKQDLVVANTPITGEGGSLSVLLGRGDGTFDPESRIDTGEVPAELVVADFNADGKPDLALAAGGGVVRVMLGAGDGTFPNRAAYSLSGFPVAMAPADFDGDGKLDLVVAGSTFTDPISSSPAIKVLLNDGDGTFTLRPPTQLSFAVRTVRAGDFNGDGKADLALGHESSDVSVLLGNGDATFGAPKVFTISPGGSARRLATGDFDADGRVDLIAVDVFLSTDNIHVLLGNGDGTLRRVTKLSGKTGPLVVEDFDGDGKLDIVSAPFIANGRSMVAFFGNGDGTFRPAPTTEIADDPQDIAAGDFDGDGRPDLAVVRSRNGAATVGRNLEVMLNVLNAPSVELSDDNYNTEEGAGGVAVTVVRTGDLSGAASINYATSNRTGFGGVASDRGDYTAAVGTLRFAPGESSKTFTVFITDDALAETLEQFHVGLSAPSGVALGRRATATVNILSDDSGTPTPAGNPINAAAFFVRQHYRDFFNREPDQAGLDFWTGQFAACGSDAQCLAAKRVDVSAAFFLSIEFQRTGYQVFRIYKATFTGGGSNRPRGLPRYLEFLRDTQAVGRGVVVGQAGWESLLQENTLGYARRWVEGAEFVSLFPQSMTAGQFVDKLFAGSEVTPTADERGTAVAAFGAGGVEGRAQALLSVTNSRSVYNRQYNAAFVLMQYIGYLRRNPNDLRDTDFAGYDFWLQKLNEFSRPDEDVTDESVALGRVRRAEMIKAFITSGEYRGRFGQP